MVHFERGESFKTLLDKAFKGLLILISQKSARRFSTPARKKSSDHVKLSLARIHVEVHRLYKGQSRRPSCTRACSSHGLPTQGTSICEAYHGVMRHFMGKVTNAYSLTGELAKLFLFSSRKSFNVFFGSSPGFSV